MSVATEPVSAQSRRRRRYAVCSGCQRHQVVRKDGLIARHRNVWVQGEALCRGADATPIPVFVPNWADFPDNPDKVLERWDYLSLPIRTLLLMLHAEVIEVAAPDVNWIGEIRGRWGGWKQWTLRMPIGQGEIERDMTARGLLAAVNGIDVSDWPVPMGVRPL